MHENREISNTPWSGDQGRSAKAINRTADMHVLEKSDCAVVPVKQPNKGGKPSAEVGEGRARAVENIVRSHMLPTQSGNCMSQFERAVCGNAVFFAFAIDPWVRAVCVDAHVRICAGGDQ